MRFMPEVVSNETDLRPIERVILRMHREGVSIPDIGKKIGKKPGTVVRIMRMVDFKDGVTQPATSNVQPLRPVERVVVKLRAEGESYGTIGNRLARSGSQVRKIEGFADLKLGG
jgi:DNA-binding CsgD family transcriptional regulator